MHAYSWSRPARTAGTERARTVEEVFGLTPERYAEVPVLDRVPLPGTGITYVTGYSGTGKSVLLRLFLADHPEAHVPGEVTDDRPLIDLFDLPLPDTLQLLGQVGLGEAFTYLTPYHRLSDGQRARARLALAYASGHRLLVIDEFLSTVDRVSAAVVAYGFQKFCRRNGVSAVVATAHGDLGDQLGPDHTVVLDYNGAKTVTTGPGIATAPFRDTTVIRPGEPADYESMERFHYMGGLDVPVEAFDMEVHVAEVNGVVAAAKVLSPPYPRSWERHSVFRDVNEALTVSRRTVVHPVFRSVGLAGRLCDPALAARPAVFIRSALGRFQPFPLSAGYTEVEVDTAQNTELARRADELAAGGLKGLGAAERALLRERAVQMLTAEYHQYRDIAGLPALEPPADQSVRTWFARCVEVMDEERLATVVKPFPMAGFVSRSSAGVDETVARAASASASESVHVAAQPGVTL
ncbi:AAA family ATPase [Streptomyces sp. NBC_00272]|uniref:AAA family ATPase n=1 Tax=Streptomyces sp. NBC_00272 TaxID=2975698 RepID=UPI002E291FC2|nr:AAA family ATPase [Streptomyces sp. NBC_00272]